MAVMTETVPVNIKKDKKKDKKEKKKTQLDDERFKPVQNPIFKVEESKRSTLLVQTPAELQGYAAQKYVPSHGYTHLDPTKHENAHSAFKQLQQIVTASQLSSSDQPQRLADGAIILQQCRALWNYEAKIASELSFLANDRFAILNRQPDGWWYAELLDPVRRKRGLVPGNYMTPV
ncbi:uncharacterized protein B0P05DRAFT_588256 [Gilbertella persicaria]|uniref:uncharacterized protein n=1 Tax=Gilbertella persicaria TaxID=101096 RepID=UPI002220B8E7|nr:uncharacterized protein B0P05DRAFT_588256 [Gilbertella persicaria]KAI8075833.1 hypothetical protein B0P05DRAFT_588256 [Gilbertella persicaria]